MKLFSFILFFIVSNSAICQTSLTTSQIDSICNVIDLSIENDSNRIYIRGIEEGEPDKSDTNIVAFETYYYLIDSTKTLKKVINNTGKVNYERTIFHYHNNELIRSIVKINKPNYGKTIYNCTYYFSKSICLNSTEENINYSYWIQLLNEGIYYLSNISNF